MRKLPFIILVGVLLLFLAPGCGQAGKKVLLIFSYHPEYAWVIDETRGVNDVFKDAGVETESFYLDTKTNTSAAWMEKVAGEAVDKINEYKPDLVIVFDDNACELVAKKYIGEDLPFVFCGMNGEPEDYGFPAKNITGVIERHHLLATTELLKQLIPGVATAAIMSDDSTTSKAFIAGILNEAASVNIIEYYTTDDFDDWKAKVEELQTKVDAIGIYVYHTLKEKGGETSLPPEEVLNWTLENNRLPDFAFSDFTVKDGVLCGVTESGYEQGKAAANIAVRILNGEAPENIPVERPDKGISIVNETRANDLNIAIPADVRQESVIVP